MLLFYPSPPRSSFLSRFLLKFCSRRDSSVGIMVRLWTGQSGVRMAAGLRKCSVLQNIQNSSEAQPACYLICTVVQFGTFYVHNKEWAVLFNGLCMLIPSPTIDFMLNIQKTLSCVRHTNNIYLSQYLTNLVQKICFKLSFISCLYMFRAHVLIIRRSKLHYTASGIIKPIGPLTCFSVICLKIFRK